MKEDETALRLDIRARDILQVFEECIYDVEVPRREVMDTGPEMGATVFSLRRRYERLLLRFMIRLTTLHACTSEAFL